MIKQDENGVFRSVWHGWTPSGNPKRIMKRGDTVVHLDPWENRGEGITMETAEVVSTQTSANGTTHTTKFRITDVHYSQETLQGDRQIHKRKENGLDIRMGVGIPNQKTMDIERTPSLKKERRPGVDWPIEKPGDPEENC